MARRYELFRDKENKYQVYNQAYDGLKMNSQILHPSKIASVHSLNFADRGGLEACLRTWKGQESKEGECFYPDSGEWRPSYLKAANERIKDIEKEFAQLKQKTINEGKRPPETMPKELQERLFQAEATLDIVKEEIEFLEKRLAGFEKEENKKSDGAVLQYGPQGIGKIRGGILVEVDGEKVNKIRMEF